MGGGQIRLNPTIPKGQGITVEGYGGLINFGAGAPTSSVNGYAKGAFYFDVTNGYVYQNVGTLDSATWVVVNGGAAAVESITAATRTLTAADSGKTFVLNLAAGIAITLPAAAAGLRFRFIVGTTFTGAASIKSATGADIMIGHATMGNDSNNSTVDWQAIASNTFDTIDLFGTANSTGGIEGQEVEIIGLAANKWFVRIQGDAAGTEATPFADTVA